MNMQLSSLELHYILKELSFITDAKIEKIRSHQDTFSIEIYIPTVGKKFLYIAQPNGICLTEHKPEAASIPSELLKQLRLHLSNARILEITQHGFDRIVQIACSTKEQQYYLIIELFHQGNIILCDSTYKVISSLQFKRWTSERSILPGKTYSFPPEKKSPAKLTVKELENIIRSSTKSSISHVLAVDLSFGGVYGEEILHRSHIDPLCPINDISSDDTIILLDQIKELTQTELSPIIIDNHAYPFTLQQLSIERAIQKKSFNEAVYTILQKQVTTNDSSAQVSPKEKKLLKIISAQKKQLDVLEAASKHQQDIGEYIYGVYPELQKLYEQVDFSSEVITVTKKNAKVLTIRKND